MENASKDVLFTIAMDLDLPSLLRWCQSSSTIQRDVCNNKNVWRNRLLRDYPNYERFNLHKSLKETYVFMYQLALIKKLLGTNENLYDIYLRKEIDLREKGLKKVPAFDLPNLQFLFLNSNQLTEVPTFNLPKLQMLHLYDNKLTKVPAFDLPELEVLTLAGNELTAVPAFDLPNLEVLNLYNNRLTAVPAFNLPKLQVLRLSRNPLTKLPTFHFPNLKELYLRNTQFEEEQKRRIINKYENKVIF